MTQLRVVHLVDDMTAGGVTRVLDHILTAPELSRSAHHEARCVDPRVGALGRIKADVIVSHLAISWRILPMLAALRLQNPRAPLVHVEHSYTEAFVAANVPRKRRFATLLKTAYRLFDRVVAVSGAQGRWLVESGAVRPSALAVIQSCVDLSAFRSLRPCAGTIRVIGAIGRLDRQKGFDTLISAFRGIDSPDAALHVYGEGAEETALRRHAGYDPRIHFKGFAADPVAAMAAVDVVAMPSLWEAYGLVAIEALAARRYLLVNPVDGISDHLVHGAHRVSEHSVEGWSRDLGALIGCPSATTGVAEPMSDGPFERAFVSGWQNLLAVLTGNPAPPFTDGGSSTIQI